MRVVACVLSDNERKSMLVFYCGVTRGHLSRGGARTGPAEPPPLGSSSAPTPPTNYDLSLLTRRPRAVLLAPASSRSLAAGGSHHHAGRPARDAALASSRETHRLLRGSARAERGRRSTHSLGRSPWSLHGGAGEQSITDGGRAARPGDNAAANGPYQVAVSNSADPRGRADRPSVAPSIPSGRRAGREGPTESAAAATLAAASAAGRRSVASAAAAVMSRLWRSRRYDAPARARAHARPAARPAVGNQGNPTGAAGRRTAARALEDAPVGGGSRQS